MPNLDGTGPACQRAGAGRGNGLCCGGPISGLRTGSHGFGRRRFISPENEMSALEEIRETLSQKLEMINKEIEALKMEK